MARKTGPAYQVIIRAIHSRGEAQRKALDEMKRRGLWLSKEQKVQAGLTQEPSP